MAKHRGPSNWQVRRVKWAIRLLGRVSGLGEVTVLQHLMVGTGVYTLFNNDPNPNNASVQVIHNKRTGDVGLYLLERDHG